MSRQAALWQYMMTPYQETGLEGRKRFRKKSGPNLVRWLRRQLNAAFGN